MRLDNSVRIFRRPRTESSPLESLVCHARESDIQQTAELILDSRLRGKDKMADDPRLPGFDQGNPAFEIHQQRPEIGHGIGVSARTPALPHGVGKRFLPKNDRLKNLSRRRHSRIGMGVRFSVAPSQRAMLQGGDQRLMRVGEAPTDHDLLCARARTIYSGSEINEHFSSRHHMQHLRCNGGTGGLRRGRCAPQFLCRQ